MSETETAGARHPIGVVVRRTGLSAEVIRAWEQRYGAVSPERTEGGQRLYTEADVQRLRLLAAAVEAGHRIGAIAGLPSAALESTVRELGGTMPTSTSEGAPAPALDAPQLVAAALAAASAADATTLRQLLRRGAVMHEPMRFVEDVIVPFLNGIGERWAAGDVTPAHEHVSSGVVRDVLGWLLDSTSIPVGAPLVLVGLPAGQRHEFGALLAGVTAGVAGWSVLPLGGDLPARDIAALAQQTGARVVAMSVVFAGEADDVRRELESLRAALGSTPLLVGGRAAQQVAPDGSGLERVDDLGALRARLDAIARTRVDA